MDMKDCECGYLGQNCSTPVVALAGGRLADMVGVLAGGIASAIRYPQPRQSSVVEVGALGVSWVGTLGMLASEEGDEFVVEEDR
jgi:hypothetical protein